MPEFINEEELVKRYNLEIGKVFFFENYLIIEVAEGICFDHNKAIELSKLTNVHFEGRPFGYISHRINSYSLEPTDYMKIKEVFPNLKAFAAVVYNRFQATSVKIENMFFQDGITTFEDLETARSWIKEQLI
ncbi:hypothetical protein U6A24_13605 [Aquimarina gracilis]|uniref:STAS/SEC14 domain-containing protein n=1 Tax=Aquimarina gracilis TaxID=874422 RepID=A0ABU5ZX91_9FLAO|nr:hypothetical protein [Aquimarina gracilis]MEB3346508.1 hypothetical protein [Aquimarina gracilis]